MLLVAQRVVSPERIQGINAYRYRHGDAPWPDDARPLLDDAAATLERTSVQLRPGGNRILSYLDIVAPDAASLDSVAGSVATFARGPAPAHFPYLTDAGSIAFRVGLEASLVPVWRTEIEDLLQRLLLL